MVLDYLETQKVKGTQNTAGGLSFGPEDRESGRSPYFSLRKGRIFRGAFVVAFRSHKNRRMSLMMMIVIVVRENKSIVETIVDVERMIGVILVVTFLGRALSTPGHLDSPKPPLKSQSFEGLNLFRRQSLLSMRSSHIHDPIAKPNRSLVVLSDITVSVNCLVGF